MSWKQHSTAPVTNSSPPIVKIKDSVYVGCGVRKDGKDLGIFEYSISLDSWSRLPDCPTYHHGLASLRDELVVIGGLLILSAGTANTNSVYTFRDRKWQQILPPMPTPRYFLSATSYNDQFIIAAGGTVYVKQNKRNVLTDIVEIYIPNQWFTTKRLSYPLSAFSMSIIGNVCYTQGGAAESYYYSSTTQYATVSSLIESAIPAYSRSTTSQRPAPWKRLQGCHPLTLASQVELNGRLFAMGGSVFYKPRQGSKFVTTYDFATNTWVECKGAELPLPLYRSGLLNLGSNKVMLIGGQTKSQQFSLDVYIGSFEYPPSRSFS